MLIEEMEAKWDGDHFIIHTPCDAKIVVASLEIARHWWTDFGPLRTAATVWVRVHDRPAESASST